jgi:hypothetical protein
VDHVPDDVSVLPRVNECGREWVYCGGAIHAMRRILASADAQDEQTTACVSEGADVLGELVFLLSRGELVGRYLEI